jgi:hypothetical protein
LLTGARAQAIRTRVTHGNGTDATGPPLRIATRAFALALAADLATKVVLSPVTYYGIVMPTADWNPVWLILPALAALFVVRTPPVAVAAGLVIAGIVGNTVYTVGVLDFGSQGAWSLADLFIADGLLSLAALLVWRMYTILAQERASRRARANGAT